eukprot:8803183-Heterocapsa_arctica.AAC.1
MPTLPRALRTYPKRPTSKRPGKNEGIRYDCASAQGPSTDSALRTVKQILRIRGKKISEGPWRDPAFKNPNLGILKGLDVLGLAGI